ncbi:hypothetical protein [Azospirillum argentinense]
MGLPFLVAIPSTTFNECDQWTLERKMPHLIGPPHWRES